MHEVYVGRNSVRQGENGNGKVGRGTETTK
jgi:hypothetical protein